MEHIIDKEEYLPDSDYSSDEYSEENDDFLLHRDSDIVDEIMNDYKDIIQLNLYDSIEVKINLTNPQDLKRLIKLLIYKDLDTEPVISFL